MLLKKTYIACQRPILRPITSKTHSLGVYNVCRLWLLTSIGVDSIATSQLFPCYSVGFDDQERNRLFVKTDFQVLNLKLKFFAYSMKQLSFASSSQPKYCASLVTRKLTSFSFGIWLSIVHVLTQHKVLGAVHK